MAISKNLIESNANVVSADILPIESDSKNQRLRNIVCDATSPQCVEQIIETAISHFGGIDLVVNNAAFTGSFGLHNYTVPFEQQGLAAWRDAMELNLTFPFSLIQSCSQHLKVSGQGSVVNIGSIYASVGPDLDLYNGTSMNNLVAYGASKGGLLQLTRYLASILAPRVRVNMVSPGGIFRDQPAEFIRRYTERVPLNRMATEDDITPLVTFLLSSQSRYITGQNVVVDGGYTTL